MRPDGLACPLLEPAHFRDALAVSDA
jgi:hypothetical protein